MDQLLAPPRRAAPEKAGKPDQSGTLKPVRGCTCSDWETACCLARASMTCSRVASCSAREVRDQYTRKPCPQTLQRTSLTVSEILQRTCMGSRGLSVCGSGLDYCLLPATKRSVDGEQGAFNNAYVPRMRTEVGASSLRLVQLEALFSYGVCKLAAGKHSNCGNYAACSEMRYWAEERYGSVGMLRRWMGLRWQTACVQTKR